MDENELQDKVSLPLRADKFINYKNLCQSEIVDKPICCW
jgi:hypothetical protein